jgi:chromatin modification-related protein EAF6
MSENIPPNAHTANSDATRGIPYYEKLKRDLREIIQKKRLLDKNMVASKIENRHLYDLVDNR